MSEEYHSTWGRWKPELAKACDGSHFTIEGIEANLQAGLWRLLAHDACCYVAEVQTYPAQVTCTIWFAAGEINALIAGLPDVEEWGRRNGCNEMLIEGPLGWKRALAPSGYAPWSITLRKGL